MKVKHLILIGMAIVFFHKPAINTSGGYAPPLDPPSPPKQPVDQRKAAQPLDTFDFNDLYAAPRNHDNQPRV